MLRRNCTIGILSAKKNILPTFFFTLRQASQLKSFHLKECCALLELPDEHFTQETLKNAYLSCCKRYHPDMSSDENDSERFIQIEKAFQQLKEYLNKKEPTKEIAVELDDDGGDLMKRKVAQHRQYLNYDGVGSGSPTARFSQYQKHRLNVATQAVHEFQVEKVKARGMRNEDGLTLRDVNLQRQIKTQQGFDRLVEDLIQEAMAKGFFNDLPGCGKPLKHRPDLPYVDSTTYKINQILIDNGYVPEWVRLEREINEEKNQIRDEIKRMFVEEGRIVENEQTMNALRAKVKAINFKIDKYNSLVPIMNKQKLHFMLANEVKRVESMPLTEINRNLPKKNKSEQYEPKGLLDSVMSLFIK